MGKIYLQSLELSDFKRVIEEIVESNISKFSLPKNQNLNILLSRKETAKLLCISLPTLNEWTKTGILKAHRIGNRVLYKEKEVIEALVEVQTLKNGRGLSC